MEQRSEAERGRAALLRFIYEEYGEEPEYLWRSAPNYCVVRRRDNRKWYVLVMDVPRARLGLKGEGRADIAELKCDPLMTGSLLRTDGILPAYHMSRGSWITVLLDGTVPPQQLWDLVRLSHSLTAPRSRSSAGRLQAGPRTWLLPANPHMYDLRAAFARSDTLLWHQRANVAAGDAVYIYMAAPVQSILYRCRAQAVNLTNGPAEGRYMQLRLEQRFQPGLLGLDLLRAHGVRAVRGLRTAPAGLCRAIGRRAPGQTLR